MGKMIAAALLYQETLPMLVAISFSEHVTLFTVSATPDNITRMNEFESIIKANKFTSETMLPFYTMQPASCDDLRDDPLTMIRNNLETIQQIKIIYPSDLKQQHVQIVTDLLFIKKAPFWDKLSFGKEEEINLRSSMR